MKRSLSNRQAVGGQIGNARRSSVTAAAAKWRLYYWAIWGLYGGLPVFTALRTAASRSNGTFPPNHLSLCQSVMRLSERLMNNIKLLAPERHDMKYVTSHWSSLCTRTLKKKSPEFRLRETAISLQCIYRRSHHGNSTRGCHTRGA